MNPYITYLLIAIIGLASGELVEIQLDQMKPIKEQMPDNWICGMTVIDGKPYRWINLEAVR